VAPGCYNFATGARKNPVDLRRGIVVQALDRMRVPIEREGDGVMP
jgi:hypothetical protein